MTDTVDDIVRDLQASVARELAAACERLRAISARPATASGGSDVDETIAPGVAVKLSGLSRAQLHRRCIKYPIDAPYGFSLLPPGKRTYRILKSRFEEHLRAFPPRRYEMRRKRSQVRQDETS